MNRLTRQILQYITNTQKQTKQMSYVKHLKKEVEIGAGGTQKYIIKKGLNKGTIV
mgnify:CR=1 FL=1|tara:strand:- start:2684 stop:2848 length:165 start_codon:yes stop_codon:yes gene_type:complete